MKTIKYHVSGDKNKGWCIKKEDSKRSIKCTKTKKTAIIAAVRIAKANRPASVYIHLDNGRIQDVRSFKAVAKKKANSKATRRIKQVVATAKAIRKSAGTKTEKITVFKKSWQDSLKEAGKRVKAMKKSK